MTWIASLAPLAYLAVAASAALEIPVRRTSLAAGWLSLGVSAAVLAAVLAGGAVSTPTLGASGLGFAIRADALSATLATLIAFIGLIVVAYSHNYLSGDAGQRRFVGQLCLALGLLLGLVLAGNLLQLVLCWIGASLCVNRLLLFRADRQAAVLAARKRFLVSRLADIALVIAAILLWRATATGDIGAILSTAKAASGPEWGAAAVLIAGAAIFSSAQLPFHGWILEVMETPTPVSALLHAGVVNAGGFLVLRLGEVVAPHAGAADLLILVGGASAVFGALVMLTQTSVKVALAYSTIAQMGFMLLECGFGAYSLALLHIVAHAFYKAHAFLSAGGAAAAAGPAEGMRAPARAVAVWILLACVGLGVVALGARTADQPGAFVLWSVLLLGLSRTWLQPHGRWGSVLALAVSAVALGAYVAAHAAFARLAVTLGWPPVAPNPVAVAVGICLVALMTGLVWLQLAAPVGMASPAWARTYALVANGFHLNTVANRWVLRLWPAPPSTAPQPGAAI